MSASAEPSASPPAKKGGALKILLIVGGIFLVLCLGVCGGVVVLVMNAGGGPTSGELAKLAPMNKTTDDLKTAIPQIQSGNSSFVTMMNRSRVNFGPHMVGAGSFFVIADSLDGSLRQVTVSVELPTGGDKAAEMAGKMATLAVLQMLDPTFAGDKIPPFMLFADATSGSQDFGPANVTIQTTTQAGRASTREYIVTLAPPGGSPPQPQTGRAANTPPATERRVFTTTVEDLENRIPLLKSTGHTTTTDHGITTTTWRDCDLNGQKHTVTAHGEPTLIESIVIETHIAGGDDKLTRMTGMLVAWSIVSQLDPTLSADQMEGFTKWSWAAMGREDYGTVNVKLRGTGTDEIGQKIEYTLTPAR